MKKLRQIHPAASLQHYMLLMAFGNALIGTVGLSTSRISCQIWSILYIAWAASHGFFQCYSFLPCLAYFFKRWASVVSLLRCFLLLLNCHFCKTKTIAILRCTDLQFHIQIMQLLWECRENMSTIKKIKTVATATMNHTATMWSRLALRCMIWSSMNKLH